MKEHRAPPEEAEKPQETGHSKCKALWGEASRQGEQQVRKHSIRSACGRRVTRAAVTWVVAQ